MSSPGNSSAGQAQDSSLLSIELQMKSLLVPPETVCDFDGITPEDFFTETNVNSSKKKTVLFQFIERKKLIEIIIENL